MHAIETLTTILNAVKAKYPLTDGTFTMRMRDGTTPETTAVLYSAYAIHADPERETYTISHAQTGYAIVRGYKDIRAAILGVQLVCHTISYGEMVDPFRIPCLDMTTKGVRRYGAKLSRTKGAKAIHKFLCAHRDVWNNAETEAMVGAFYKDRARCERLRHKINPSCPVEYLDPQAHDERMISDLMRARLMA